MTNGDKSSNTDSTPDRSGGQWNPEQESVGGSSGHEHHQPYFEPPPHFGQPPHQHDYSVDEGRPPAAGFPASPAGGQTSGPAGTGGSANGSRRTTLGFIIAGAAVGLILTMIGAGAVVKIAGSHNIKGSGEPTRHHSSARPVDATEAVKGYLHAVADGNAQKALDYLGKKPSDTTLLTDKMLRASSKQAAITDIEVSKPSSSGAASVRAKYKIGSNSVKGDYSVSKSAGRYVLDDGYAELNLHKRKTKLPLTVNGTTLRRHKAIVFPGTYKLDTTSPYTKLAHTWKLTVEGPVKWSPSESPTPKLTHRGQRLFQKTVIKEARACVASKKLRPGCGLGISTKRGDKLQEGTVSRKVKGKGWSEFDGLKGILDPSDPLLIMATPFAVFVKTRASSNKSGGGTRRVELLGKAFGRPKMDLSKRHPEVTWE